MIKDKNLDIDPHRMGTPKSLEEAILNALQICGLNRDDGDAYVILISKVIRDYLAQGLGTEMIRAKNATEVQIIERLAQRWKINR